MWLLIGCGSSLHSDDRLGWVVVETVAGAFDPTNVEAIVAVQLFPELAEPISRAEGVIFVDADATLPPGKIGCVNLTSNPFPFHGEGSLGVSVPPLYELVRGLGGEITAHHLTPQAVLNAARVLYGRAPEAWLYSVG